LFNLICIVAANIILFGLLVSTSIEIVDKSIYDCKKPNKRENIKIPFNYTKKYDLFVDKEHPFS